MKSKIISAVSYLFLSVTALLSIFPLVWMAIAATNESNVVLKGTMIPGRMLSQNFAKLLSLQNLGGAMKNSFLNAIVLTFLALLICSIAGYGFEIYHSKGKDIAMNVLLTTMMIPFVATLVPLFQMFSKMKFLPTMFAVILPTISTPFLIMLFRQSARSFPHDIIEAARLDGLNELQIFFRMFVPTMTSTYSAALTVTFMSAWNNYLWPRVVASGKDAVTMPLLIANLRSGYITDYGVLMLAVLICSIPTIVIFLILQRSFAEGITGSVK